MINKTKMSSMTKFTANDFGMTVVNFKYVFIRIFRHI